MLMVDVGKTISKNYNARINAIDFKDNIFLLNRSRS